METQEGGRGKKNHAFSIVSRSIAPFPQACLVINTGRHGRINSGLVSANPSSSISARPRNRNLRLCESTPRRSNSPRIRLALAPRFHIRVGSCRFRRHRSRHAPPFSHPDSSFLGGQFESASQCIRQTQFPNHHFLGFLSSQLSRGSWTSSKLASPWPSLPNPPAKERKVCVCRQQGLSPPRSSALGPVSIPSIHTQ